MLKSAVAAFFQNSGFSGLKKKPVLTRKKRTVREFEIEDT